MLVPAVSDVVRTIAGAIDDILAPALTTPHQRSTVVTIGHMLRYVEIAVEREGEALFDEANRLRSLLGEIGARAGLPEPLATIGAAMRAAAAVPRDAAVYPSAPLLAAEIRAATGLVDEMLTALHSLPTSERTDATAEVHQAIRAHIAWQLENQARTIEPAFVGQGARR